MLLTHAFMQYIIFLTVVERNWWVMKSGCYISKWCQSLNGACLNMPTSLICSRQKKTNKQKHEYVLIHSIVKYCTVVKKYWDAIFLKYAYKG